MWIYQESSEPRLLSVTQTEPDVEIHPAVVTDADIRKDPENEMKSSPEQRVPVFSGYPIRKKLAPVNRDCFLLAGAYLFGTFLSGVVQMICSDPEKDMLSYYLSCWSNLFTVVDADALPRLFGTELWTILGALLVLFLLGLSAVGPVFIVLFLMLYGLGSGLLFSQWVNGAEIQTFFVFLFTAGLPAAIAAGGLCLFGASALQVSSRIQMFSFHRGEEISHKAGAGLLTGQFVLMATAFLPLCGIATGLAYLAAQFVS